MIDSQRLNMFNVSVEIEPDRYKYIFLAPLRLRAMR